MGLLGFAVGNICASQSTASCPPQWCSRLRWWTPYCSWWPFLGPACNWKQRDSSVRCIFPYSRQPRTVIQDLEFFNGRLSDLACWKIRRKISAGFLVTLTIHYSGSTYWGGIQAWAKYNKFFTWSKENNLGYSLNTLKYWIISLSQQAFDKKLEFLICYSRKDGLFKILSLTTVPLNLENKDRRLQLRQPGKNASRVQKQAFSIYLYRLKIVGTFSLYILETVLEEICAMFFEEMFLLLRGSKIYM